MALFISRFANAHLIDAWVRAFEQTRANPFEQAALVAFFEGARTLLERRNTIDDVRREHAWEGAIAGDGRVTHGQQMKLYRATRAFFDEMYTNLSLINGIISRHYSVFETNFSENAPMLTWLARRYPDLQHELFTDLERARLFRAILAHPQQFPPYTWSTATNPSHLTFVVLWGPLGRGKNPVPRGATTSHPGAHLMPGWQFEAPDEVSVSNSLLGVGVEVLSEVYASLSARSPFRRSYSKAEALDVLMPDLDFSHDRRRVTSEVRADDTITSNHHVVIR
ncbi:hypothetical protein [Microbacterium oleivorans]|uniref:hypothetical protein n=1 Tax=Microbacterium oleivorans TaxID=273677 RepID=UPI00203F82FA|nr:hypothetical protein [Microbacterium oleivorans]MCM3696896.1 hypothetical protein [Microbacterium oleivorans]